MVGRRQIVSKETYQHGRRLAGRTDRDPAGGRKTEGLYLFAKEVVKTPDDWWDGKLAVYIKTGKDEKHGPWVSWYPSGNGTPKASIATTCRWANSAGGMPTARRPRGAYIDGEQDGKWVWWHENGQKSILGEYTKGHPSGRWTWWNEDGKVARSTEMENGAGEIVTLPEKPQVRMPARQGTKPAVVNPPRR